MIISRQIQESNLAGVATPGLGPGDRVFLKTGTAAIGPTAGFVAS
jgi:hypothetical protein